MNKKLHRVEVILYVLAEDEFDACWAATNARFDIFECMAKEAETIDPGWEDAVPYNSEDDRTCSEILTNRTQQGDRPENMPETLPAPWAINVGVAPMKNLPRQQTWSLKVGLQMIRNFLIRLANQTEQDMTDAGVNRRLVP